MRQNILKITSLLIAAFAIAGVILQMQSEMASGLESLKMFTTLSNIYIAIFFIARAIWLFRGGKGAFCPGWHISAIVSISLTGIVAATMLGGMFVNSSGTMKLALLFLHDITPLATVLDWLLISPKGGFKKIHVILAIMPAAAYLATALILPLFGLGLGLSGSSYPYPFMNVDMLGVQTVAVTCVIMGLVLVAYSALIVFIDHMIAKHSTSKKDGDKDTLDSGSATD